VFMVMIGNLEVTCLEKCLYHIIMDAGFKDEGMDLFASFK